MHPTSELILRNPVPEGKHMLLINPAADDYWQQWTQKQRSLSLFYQDFTEFKKLEASDSVVFGAFPENPKVDFIILRLPREKARLEMMLDCCAGLLASDGQLWLVGENKAGIKSSDKRLKQYFHQVQKLDSARHCSLFQASSAIQSQEEPFNPEKYHRQWTLKRPQGALELSSYPGVFTHGQLDPGSELLLEVMDHLDIKGDILDFGCGSGLLGLSVLLKHPASRLTLLDNNALALLATESSLKANGLQGIVIPSDGLSEVAGRYNWIISNPPFHSGVQTTVEITRQFIAQAPHHLKKGGRVLIVANRHLPYQQMAAEYYRQVQTVKENTRFHVLEMRL